MARSPYYFDKDTADRACEFFPRFLRFTKGEWAGKPFHLAPWQEFHTGQMFGWRRRKDGFRRYRRVRGWVARKNGKSEWFAGIGHLLTIGDNEPGAEVYSHALDKSQASILWEMAERMVALSEPLSNLYEVTRTALFCPATMSTFRPLSGESYGKHGLSPSGIIGDEAHAWRSNRLHTFLWQGTGARRQPFDITISTAGEIKTYGHELYEQSMAVLEDPTLDQEMYVFNYAADPKDDWTEPTTWAKANPNLGVSVKLEDLASECKRALRSPRRENDFKRYKLNLWVEQASRWFPMHRWSDNTAHPDDKLHWKKLPELLSGNKHLGYLGLDLGSTSDITAAVWVFPPNEISDRVTLIPRFWVPEDKINERDSPKTPYRKWVAEGALLTTPGNVTDYDFLEESIYADAVSFGCAGIAYDPWNATQVAVHLQEEGLPCQEFRQGYASMAAPSKELERLFISGKIEHGSHPVLEWMFGNATYRKDPAGNIKPDKERAAEKIDGVVATCMGLGLMNSVEEDHSTPIVNVY